MKKILSRLLPAVVLALMSSVLFAGTPVHAATRHLLTTYFGSYTNVWGPGGSKNTNGISLSFVYPSFDTGCNNCLIDDEFTMTNTSTGEESFVGFEEFSPGHQLYCLSSATYGCFFYHFSNQSKVYTGTAQNILSSDVGQTITITLSYFVSGGGGMNLWIKSAHGTYCNAGAKPTCTSAGAQTAYNEVVYSSDDSSTGTSASIYNVTNIIDNGWLDNGNFTYRNGAGTLKNNDNPCTEAQYWVSPPAGSSNKGGNLQTGFDC